MSPSWLEPFKRTMRRESHHILLAPYRVEFSHERHGDSAEHLVLECNAAANSGWPNSIAMMTAGLERLEWRDADVHISLSNHFVRYALVPGLATLRARDERMLAARHQLAAIYGERTQRWQLALHDWRGTHDSIAAGTAQDLLQQLVAATTQAQLNLCAVEPVFATAFNALRQEIRKAPTWFCVAEPGRLVLAYFENLHWRFLQTERQRGDLGETLRPLLQRACVANSASPGRVLLVADAPAPDGMLSDADWSLEWHPLSEAPAAQESLQ